MKLFVMFLVAIPLWAQDCVTFFHVARLVESDIQENETTENMRKWWSKSGQKKYPELCYTEILNKADYVVTWSRSTELRTADFQVPKRSSSSTTGTVGGNPVSLDTTTTSTRTETFENTLTTIAFVIRESLRGPVLFHDDRVGRFGWSQPDKNALEDALKAIRAGFENVKPENQSGLATRR